MAKRSNRKARIVRKAKLAAKLRRHSDLARLDRDYAKRLDTVRRRHAIGVRS